ncbi:MAG: hypothetical protein WCP96_17095 [Methylococcaceae bacterium]
MTCCTLELIDDAFGVPIDESFINRIPQRGEWRGLTMAVYSGRRRAVLRRRVCNRNGNCPQSNQAFDDISWH